jgi:hypothetical protein
MAVGSRELVRRRHQGGGDKSRFGGNLSQLSAVGASVCISQASEGLHALGLKVIVARHGAVLVVDTICRTLTHVVFPAAGCRPVRRDRMLVEMAAAGAIQRSNESVYRWAATSEKAKTFMRLLRLWFFTTPSAAPICQWYRTTPSRLLQSIQSIFAAAWKTRTSLFAFIYTVYICTHVFTYCAGCSVQTWHRLTPETSKFMYPLLRKAKTERGSGR